MNLPYFDMRFQLCFTLCQMDETCKCFTFLIQDFLHTSVNVCHLILEISIKASLTSKLKDSKLFHILSSEISPSVSPISIMDSANTVEL